jgi:hypothetical protein
VSWKRTTATHATSRGVAGPDRGDHRDQPDGHDDKRGRRQVARRVGDPWCRREERDQVGDEHRQGRRGQDRHHALRYRAGHGGEQFGDVRPVLAIGLPGAGGHRKGRENREVFALRHGQRHPPRGPSPRGGVEDDRAGDGDQERGAEGGRAPELDAEDAVHALLRCWRRSAE